MNMQTVDYSQSLLEVSFSNDAFVTSVGSEHRNSDSPIFTWSHRTGQSRLISNSQYMDSFESFPNSEKLS